MLEIRGVVPIRDVCQYSLLYDWLALQVKTTKTKIKTSAFALKLGEFRPPFDPTRLPVYPKYSDNLFVYVFALEQYHLAHYLLEHFPGVWPGLLSGRNLMLTLEACIANVVPDWGESTPKDDKQLAVLRSVVQSCPESVNWLSPSCLDTNGRTSFSKQSSGTALSRVIEMGVRSINPVKVISYLQADGTPLLRRRPDPEECKIYALARMLIQNGAKVSPIPVRFASLPCVNTEQHLGESILKSLWMFIPEVVELIRSYASHPLGALFASPPPECQISASERRKTVEKRELDFLWTLLAEKDSVNANAIWQEDRRQMEKELKELKELKLKRRPLVGKVQNKAKGKRKRKEPGCDPNSI